MFNSKFHISFVYIYIKVLVVEYKIELSKLQVCRIKDGTIQFDFFFIPDRKSWLRYSQKIELAFCVKIVL